MQYQPHLPHPQFLPAPAPAKQPSSIQNLVIAFLLVLVVGMGGMILIYRSFEAPGPLSATLIVSATEPTEVSVNDELIGVAEEGLPLVRDVYPGKYLLRMVAKKRSPVVKEVEVKGNEVKTLHFESRTETGRER